MGLPVYSEASITEGRIQVLREVLELVEEDERVERLCIGGRLETYTIIPAAHFKSKIEAKIKELTNE